MKLENMILVTENWKGSETNFLMDLADYMAVILKACDLPIDMARSIEELYDSKEDPKLWNELYLSANKTFYAKFCTGESQLRRFLLGDFNEENERKKEFTFDEKRCSKGCLEVLLAYGLQTDGHRLISGLHYEAINRVFHVGETIHNFNGIDYQVLDVLSPENLLLRSANTGEILIGCNTKYFKRMPKESFSSNDCILYGVEWGGSVFLRKNLTENIFENIRSAYGISKERETLTDYRNRKEYEFNLYRGLMNCGLFSHEIKYAAEEALEKEFQTQDPKEFQALLEQGIYDVLIEKRTDRLQEKSR